MTYQKEMELSKDWAKTLHCSTVQELNDIIEHGDIGELIRISEALHEKKVAYIADQIAQDIARKKVILIAGPSSSGKTSFAQRLRVQLRVLGLDPISVSVDDYFVNKEVNPRKPNGDYDFECIEALDLKLFNEQLVQLLKGQEVAIPKYNFKTGHREEKPSAVVQLKANQLLIYEGIHCLNNRLTEKIPRENKFMIYVSALTPLQLAENVKLSTTKARLFRRMVRDYRTRGTSASQTIQRWPDVVAGEKVNIYPYQDGADAMFNSTLLYELGVLKKYAMYILAEIEPWDPSYGKAQELLSFCRYIKNIQDEKDVPATSILREIIGGSCFDVG
ncbi:MAG: nucleoside kinase [Anaerovibrio sp.]|nr:nucleoside kinase [Selenomonadaceae bacterium]MDY6052754.1 nucleoside kinase [Anaerovibrio sp.]